MTSRYPFHFGFYNNQDANNYGVPLNFTMLPEIMRAKGNYATHMIGKVRVLCLLTEDHGGVIIVTGPALE
jgi:arylsulfatase A-like enzyme